MILSPQAFHPRSFGSADGPAPLTALPRTHRHWHRAGSLLGVTALLAACGGGGSDAPVAPARIATDAEALRAGGRGPAASAPASAAAATASTASAPEAVANALTAPDAAASPPAAAAADAATTASPAPAPSAAARDAVRLADQASFGPTEALLEAIRSQGAAAWIRAQLGAAGSRYTSGQGPAVHQYVGNADFCADRGPDCGRDWYSSEPLLWDFYRNAVEQPDQLRQRVAFALQQIVVVNNLEVNGTYGFRRYYNGLLDGAFGNYREVLKQAALSPLMGDFLNNANNHKSAPNENFARELLQLFAIGTCELNVDGSKKGGTCRPTYSNETVRNYAYALTGWTYPAGGATPYGCWPAGANCRYYDGDMTPVAAFHDGLERKLLSSVTVAAGSSAPAALESVLDSLMAHPNIGPFIGRQLIQHLVMSNPSASYVSRVAQAFNAGSHQGIGSGRKGDLAATVAAVLLDAEARAASPVRSDGKLREPVQLFTGVLRALNGRTDGEALGWWWGSNLRQHVFRPPSVFNFYSPDYPVAGTALVGPTFGIHNVNSAFERLNFLTFALDWGGAAPAASVPGAVGTKVDLSGFVADAGDAGRLVDRLSLLALGQPLPAVPREKVVAAVAHWTAANAPTEWQLNRVKAAAYLVFASPQYQVLR